MTTASSDGQRRLRQLAYVAHKIPTLAVLSLVFAMPSWFDLDELRWVTGWVSTGVTLALFLGLAHTFPVMTSDCIRCLDEIPLDPQHAIERNAWALWFTHALDYRPLWTWVSLIGGVLLTATVVSTTGVTLFYIPYDVVFVAACFSTWRHHYLAPWCPHCQGGWGDGGQPEVVPDPDPAEQGTR